MAERCPRAPTGSQKAGACSWKPHSTLQQSQQLLTLPHSMGMARKRPLWGKADPKPTFINHPAEQPSSKILSLLERRNPKCCVLGLNESQRSSSSRSNSSGEERQQKQRRGLPKVLPSTSEHASAHVNTRVCFSRGDPSPSPCSAPR